MDMDIVNHHMFRRLIILGVPTEREFLLTEKLHYPMVIKVYSTKAEEFLNSKLNQYSFY